MLLPGSCRLSITRTRICTLQATVRQLNKQFFEKVPLIHLGWQMPSYSVQTQASSQFWTFYENKRSQRKWYVWKCLPWWKTKRMLTCLQFSNMRDKFRMYWSAQSSMYICAGEACIIDVINYKNCAFVVIQEQGNQKSDNTWKSWGLLARALFLLRLRRIGLWLGFPGWFGKAGAPGLPSWPPPSTSASPSSTSSLPSVEQNHNNHIILWINIPNIFVEEEKPTSGECVMFPLTSQQHGRHLFKCLTTVIRKNKPDQQH